MQMDRGLPDSSRSRLDKDRYRVQWKTLGRTLAKCSAVKYNRSKVENSEKDVKKA